MYIHIIYNDRLKDLVGINSTLIELNSFSTINEILSFIINKYNILFNENFFILLNNKHIINFNEIVTCNDIINLIPILINNNN